VIVGGPNVNPGYKLVQNAALSGRLPTISLAAFACSSRFPATFSWARTVSYFGMEEKYCKN
jgi:hypothetical protein